MRLAEMIIKAKEDGKTYVNRRDEVTYSTENGFNGSDIRALLNDGWEELQKRRLTVAQAEKELDCVICEPNINRISMIPNCDNNVLVIPGKVHSGYYSKIDNCWKILDDDEWKKCTTGFWIDLRKSMSQISERE